MKATTNIDGTKVITHPTTGFDGNQNTATGAGQTQGTEGRGGGTGTEQGQAPRASFGLRHGGTASP